MSKTNILYCRLEIHDSFSFNKSSSDKKEKSLGWGTRATVYVENYQDYISLKERILKISKIWFGSNAEDGESNFESNHTEYPMFCIYNQKNEFGTISFTSKGWLAPINNFYGYLAQYFVKIYGKDKYSEYLFPLKGEMIAFLGPEREDTYINEIELVSNHLIDILLQRFFDKQSISDEALKKALHQEMVSRNYL